MGRLNDATPMDIVTQRSLLASYAGSSRKWCFLAFRDQHCAGAVGVRNEQREFLAAEPRRKIRWPVRSPDQTIRNHSEERLSRDMPTYVIKLLEAADVQQQE
jgi:hypothetical protein